MAKKNSRNRNNQYNSAMKNKPTESFTENKAVEEHKNENDIFEASLTVDEGLIQADVIEQVEEPVLYTEVKEADAETTSEEVSEDNITDRVNIPTDDVDEVPAIKMAKTMAKNIKDPLGNIKEYHGIEVNPNPAPIEKTVDVKEEETPKAKPVVKVEEPVIKPSSGKYQIIFIAKATPLQIKKTTKRLKDLKIPYEQSHGDIVGQIYLSESEAIAAKKYFAGQGLKPIIREL